MSYRSLIVSLEVGRPCGSLLKATRGLADRFDASVTGIAACIPLCDLSGNLGDGYFSAEVIQMDRDRIDRQLKDVADAFGLALAGRGRRVDFRTSTSTAALSDCVSRLARCGDLVVVGVEHARSHNPSRSLDMAALVLHAGRPVLIVPHGVSELPLAHAMVAWKNTTEARRAISNALPLLKMADRVTLAAIAAKDDVERVGRELDDIQAWLTDHDISANRRVLPQTGEDSTILEDLAGKEGADLLVAGAYGHSRAREWALGGVTRDLLLNGRRAVLLSH